jgi:hypothetical protein
MRSEGYDRIEGSTTRPFFSMFINGVADVSDTTEYSATLKVAVDQNSRTIAITVDDEFDKERVSFRLSIGEAKVLSSLLASIGSLVKEDDETLDGAEFDRGDEDD